MTADCTTATRLTFAFSEIKDRLIIWTSDGDGDPVALALTRRMTERVIDGLACVLQQSSLAARQAPRELRDDVVLIEHHGALADAGQGRSSPSSSSASEASRELAAPPQLVATINVTTMPREFRLEFVTTGGSTVLIRLNRVGLHRLVDVLRRKAEDADWNLPRRVSWLELGRVRMVLQ